MPLEYEIERMKILYVPFPRNQAGDLKSMVELWKKTMSNFPLIALK